MAVTPVSMGTGVMLPRRVRAVMLALPMGHIMAVAQGAIGAVMMTSRETIVSEGAPAGGTMGCMTGWLGKIAVMGTGRVSRAPRAGAAMPSVGVRV